MEEFVEIVKPKFIKSQLETNQETKEKWQEYGIKEKQRHLKKIGQKYIKVLDNISDSLLRPTKKQIQKETRELYEKN